MAARRKLGVVIHANQDGGELIPQLEDNECLLLLAFTPCCQLERAMPGHTSDPFVKSKNPQQ
jgi:hypothetical protein